MRVSRIIFFVFSCTLLNAISLQLKAQKNPNIKKNMGLGDQLFAAKKYKEAKEKYDIALKIDEGCKECQTGMANCEIAIKKTVIIANRARTRIIGTHKLSFYALDYGNKSGTITFTEKNGVIRATGIESVTTASTSGYLKIDGIVKIKCDTAFTLDGTISIDMLENNKKKECSRTGLFHFRDLHAAWGPVSYWRIREQTAFCTYAYIDIYYKK